MIKTVIFDLGKVIVPFDFARGYRALAPHCPFAPEDIPARIGSTDLVTRFETGLIEPEEFYGEFRALLELAVSYESFREIWTSIFLPHTLVPESLLEGLHRRYRLLLLSNTNAIHFPMVERTYPLLRHFDDYVLSHRVRALKPSLRIYREAIARAGCEPHECFFTDDIPAYVEGARAAGIDAVQFLSCGQLEGELRARSIQWG